MGGAARFVSVQNEYRDKERYAGQVDLVTFFSGDAFNPSIESSITKVFPSYDWVSNGRVDIWFLFYAMRFTWMLHVVEIMVLYS